MQKEFKIARPAGTHCAFSRAEKLLPPSTLFLHFLLPSEGHFISSCPLSVQPSLGEQLIAIPGCLSRHLHRAICFSQLLLTLQRYALREAGLAFSKPLAHLNNLLLEEKGSSPSQLPPQPSHFLQRVPVGDRKE